MPSILTAVKIARIFNEPVENVFIFEEKIYESGQIFTLFIDRGIIGGMIGASIEC